MTDLFVKIVLVGALIDTLSMPLVSGLQAANRIKEIQLTVSLIYLLNIPISYLFLYLGYPAVTPMYVNIALIVIAFIPRIWIAHHILGLSVRQYAHSVLLRISMVSIVSAFACYLIYSISVAESMLAIIGFSALMCIVTLTVIGIVGVTGKERLAFVKIVKNKIHR